jgi:hypothetical protein
MRIHRPKVEKNSDFEDILTVEMSAYNIFELAVNLLRNHKKHNGIGKMINRTVVVVTADPDEIHYVPDSIPPTLDRVYLIDQMIRLAQKELERLDPQGCIRLQAIAQHDQSDDENPLSP